MFGAKNPSSRFLGRLRESTRGAVAVIGALSLTSMIGMGAMAVEATRGYSAKVTNQRVADAAALAGALAYNVNNSTTQMTATAKAVVVAQGLSANDADVQLVADGARQLVQVTVTTTVPLALGKVLTNAVSYDVAAVGSATATTVSASPHRSSRSLPRSIRHHVHTTLKEPSTSMAWTRFHSPVVRYA